MPDTQPRKHILITGASSEIGETLAKAYVAPEVVLTLSGHDPERLETVVKSCHNSGAEVHPIVIDTTDRTSMQNWIKAADQGYRLISSLPMPASPAVLIATARMISRHARFSPST